MLQRTISLARLAKHARFRTAARVEAFQAEDIVDSHREKTLKVLLILWGSLGSTNLASA